MIVDFFLFEKVAVTLLRQRCVEDQAGDLFFRMKDGHGPVRLTRGEWEELNRQYAAAVRPSAKALRWATYLTVPFSIAVAALIFNLPPLRWAVEHLGNSGDWVLWVFITTLLPVWAMLRHSINVRRTIDEVEACLADRKRCDLPLARVPKAPTLFEILALVLVGPHLIVEIIGTASPDFFLNTPWTGAHLDLAGIAGIAIFAMLGWFRWRRTQNFWPQRDSAQATTGRRTDAFARAREADA